MANTLQGGNVAIKVADGVERISLEKPRDAVQQEGAYTVFLSVKSSEIDGNQTSSRWPGDLPAFCEAIVDEFAKAPAGAG